MKVLIIGSDLGVRDIINQCHIDGDYVIIVDYYENNDENKKIADESWLISTTNINEIVKLAKENNVNAVIAGASDFNMENARLIAKKLHLPIFNENDEAWELSRNKRLFKDLCKKYNILVPKDYTYNDIINDKVIYPVVIKPIDCSGNKGISFCKNKQEALIGYEQAKIISKNKEIIIEEQIIGKIFEADYVAYNKDHTLYCFSEEIYNKKYPKNIYSVFISRNKNLEKYLKTVNNKLKQLFKENGYYQGIMWVEMIFNIKDNNFYILENGYRFPAEMLFKMQDKISSFNSIKLVLDYSKGINNNIILPSENILFNTNKLVSFFIFPNNDGKVSKINNINQIQEDKNFIIDIPKINCINFKKFVGGKGSIRFISSNENIPKYMEMINNLEMLNENNDDLLIKFTDIDYLINE